MNFDLEGGGHGAGEDDGRSSLHDRREHGLKIQLAIHAIYLAFNGLLYMVIQINYQNHKNSPFETHMAMKSSVIALCVYFCATALQIKIKLTGQSNIELEKMKLLYHIIICSGILSLLSNALVFFSNKVGWIVVVLFVFATTILLAYDVFKLISNCIFKRNNSLTATSEPVALETSTHNATTTSESEETNESSRNNNDMI